MADPHSQVILYHQISNIYIAAFKPSKEYVQAKKYTECGESDAFISTLWKNELLFPAYLAVFSATALILRGILSLKSVQGLISRRRVDEEEEEDVTVEPTVSPHTGIISDVKTHIESMGGPTIFAYKVLRLVGCLVLVVLTIVTLVIDEEEREKSDGFGVARKKHKGRKKKKSKSGFTDAEWLQVALCLTYVSARLS